MLFTRTLGRPWFVAVTVVLGLVTGGHAQEAVKPAAGPAWQVDATASRIYVKVTASTRLGHNHGIVGKLTSGVLHGTGTGSLVFEMTSFTADTPEARQYVGLEPKFSASDAQKVTSNMLGADVLNVARYPQANFAIATFAPQDGQKLGAPGRYHVKGDFTLHGVKQTVQFLATLEPTDKPGVLHMQGTFGIQQTSYGIKPYTAMGGLVGIGDTLQIWGDLRLVPASH